jgi:transcriptional regulator GlxA family with amidase domain
MTIRRVLKYAALLTLLVAGAALWYVGWPRAEWEPYAYGSAARAKLPRMTMLNHERVMGQVLGEPKMPVRSIGILVYDGVSTIEAVSAMVTMSELMNVTVEYVARDAGPVESDRARILAHRALRDVSALDVVIVPGGTPEAVARLRADTAHRQWLRDIDRESQITAGIGAGRDLLAEAGPFADRRFTDARYAQDGKYWSTVGGTSALDLGLALVDAIGGRGNLQGAMLDLEYDPQPSFAIEPTVPAVPTADTAQLQPVRVGILVYDGFFTLDAIGPLVVLSEAPNTTVTLVRQGGSDSVRTGRTTLLVSDEVSEVPSLDVLVVPGGSTGTWAMTQDSAVLGWIRRIDTGSQFTTSVCTGSWVLGAAGLLDGRRATSNWYRAGQMMSRYGATFVPERYVVDGKYWTSAGVSAGIDMSIALVAKLSGEQVARDVTRRLQYAPQPPAPGGSPAKTDDLVLDMMQQMYDFLMVPLIRK